MSDNKHYIHQSPPCSLCGRDHSAAAFVFGDDAVVYLCEDHVLAFSNACTQVEGLRPLPTIVGKMIETGTASTGSTPGPKDQMMCSLFIDRIREFEAKFGKDDDNYGHIPRMVKAGIIVESDK